MASAAARTYGAYELKQKYQRNMLLGSGFAAFLTAFCIFSVWLYNVITYEEIEARNVIRIQTIADLGAPPSLQAKPPQIDIAKPNVTAPKIGIPTPVPEEEVLDEDVVIASQEELQEINTPDFLTSGNGEGSDIVIDIPEGDYMPPPDSFIAVEVYPQVVYQEQPKYPRLAQQGGFTGKVVIQAYVDKNGDVKKAQAVKEVPENMGFGEAAVEAAYKYKYRPAIQNGNPVGVWVTYPVNFSLD
jgi:TonB family protein